MTGFANKQKHTMMDWQLPCFYSKFRKMLLFAGTKAPVFLEQAADTVSFFERIRVAVPFGHLG
jgi:hypothetical protein